MRSAGCNLLLLFVTIGCGQAQPTLAGGKPINHWLEALKNKDAKVRKEAVFKLGNVGMEDPAAFPAVLHALEDSAASVRCEAILAVVRFGDQAEQAIPILQKLNHGDQNARVRSYASKALISLQKEGSS
jgi:HEAT repeat protein